MQSKNIELSADDEPKLMEMINAIERGDKKSANEDREELRISKAEFKMIMDKVDNMSSIIAKQDSDREAAQKVMQDEMKVKLAAEIDKEIEAAKKRKAIAAQDADAEKAWRKMLSKDFTEAKAALDKVNPIVSEQTETMSSADSKNDKSSAADLYEKARTQISQKIKGE